MRRLGVKRLAFCLAALLWSAGMVTVVWAATITVRTGSYYFEDATVGDGQIVASVGDRLQFLIEDSGKGTPHTIESDALGIHSGPLTTNTTYTTPVLSQPGTFYFYCKPHENKGHHTNVVVLGNATATSTPAPAPTAPPTPAPTAAVTPAPTAAVTSAPTAAAPSAAATTPSSATAAPPAAAATPASSAEATGRTPASGQPSASQAGTPLPSNDNAVARSGGGQVVRAPTTIWLRSVFVGLLLLAPVLGLAGLAGWLSSRRRSS